MTRSIDVWLGEQAKLVGRLRFNRRGQRESSAFEYDVSWLTDPDHFRIDPALPLVKGSQFPVRSADTAFHAAVADTEPDGWAKNVILRDHAHRRATGELLEGGLTSLEFLLAVDDQSRIGALRFRDEAGVFQRAAERRRRTPPLVDLDALLRASRAVEQNTETAQDLAYLRGRGTSLGGLRPKCTVLEEDGQLALGKFPSVQDTRSIPKGEVLALQLATLAGIHAATGRLVDADGVPVAVIRRFDRPRAGGRRMYVSAATMLGADSHGEHSYTEIVDAIRRHGAEARTDVTELWRRIAFSILITNVDDHLRNHGFLHAAGELWRLAPAFDLNPAPDRARELKTWISEAVGPAASVEALFSVNAYFGLKVDEAKRILGEVVGAVRRWRSVGKELGMSRTELEQFAAAFEHPERAVADRLL